MNANQNTITRIVAAILDPNETIFPLSLIDAVWIQKESLSLVPLEVTFLGPHATQREATDAQNDPDNHAQNCGKESFIREPVGKEKEQCR